MPPALLLPVIVLPVIVALAFLVEATVGFGATLLTVTLAAHLFPVDHVLARFLPVNLLLSAWLVARNHTLVDLALVRSIVPWMGAGVVAGLLLHDLHDQLWMKRVFGGVVLAMALLELLRSHAPAPEAAAGLSPGARRAVLGAAGVVHGLFACAGPLVVWVTSRDVPDKGRFRATLSTVWLVFGVVLNARFVAAGEIDAGTLAESAILLLPLAFGLVAGNFLHDRVPQKPFRIGVYGLLFLAGLALMG